MLSSDKSVRSCAAAADIAHVNLLLIDFAAVIGRGVRT